MEITEFLETRFAEIEELAGTATEFGNANWEPGEAHRWLINDTEQPLTWAESSHIAFHDPAYVLADIAAKREIVRRWVVQAEIKLQVDLEQTHGWWTVCLLAQPFRDHPDFDSAWEV